MENELSKDLEPVSIYLLNDVNVVSLPDVKFRRLVKEIGGT